MKGNRSSDGATLPGVPFEWSPVVIAAPIAQPEVAGPGPRRIGLRRRALLLPSIAMIGIVGIVVAIAVAISGGGESRAAAENGTVPDESVSIALPGTPTHTPELTSTSPSTPTTAPAETPATDLATTASASAPSTVAPTVAAATAAPTIAVPVRVRYEVLPGDSCDLLRQKFGFPAAALDNFATALTRISGRPPASGCNFRQSDVICIPTPADLEQLDVLTRDAGCLLGVTPAAGS